jgi:hypothetical protein
MLTWIGSGSESDAASDVDIVGSRDYSARYILLSDNLIPFVNLPKRCREELSGTLGYPFLLWSS